MYAALESGQCSLPYGRRDPQKRPKLAKYRLAFCPSGTFSPIACSLAGESGLAGRASLAGSESDEEGVVFFLFNSSLFTVSSINLTFV